MFALTTQIIPHVFLNYHQLAAALLLDYSPLPEERTQTTRAYQEGEAKIITSSKSMDKIQ